MEGAVRAHRKRSTPRRVASRLPSGAGASAGGHRRHRRRAVRRTAAEHGAHRQLPARAPADLDGDRAVPDHHRGVLRRPAPVRQDLAGPGRQRDLRLARAWTSPTRPANRSPPPSSSSTSSRRPAPCCCSPGCSTIAAVQVTASAGRSRHYRDTLRPAALDDRHRHRRPGPVLRDEPVRADHEPGLRAGLRRRLLRHALAADRLARRGDHRLRHLLELPVRRCRPPQPSRPGSPRC